METKKQEEERKRAFLCICGVRVCGYMSGCAKFGIVGCFSVYKRCIEA